METFFSNFHFLRPWWLLAILLPLVGYFRFFAGMKNISAWEGVCDRNLLAFLLVKGSSRQRSLIANLLLVGMIGAVLALAGPSWQKKEIPAFAPENPVMFLLNLSSDMDATDVTPNRLARAKFAVSDLLKPLGNVQSGLVVYTDEPFLISPLTEDRRVIDNLLGAITPDIMPENGDRLNRALDYAVVRLEEAGYRQGNIVVLAADAGQDFNLAVVAAADARAKGYKVSVLDVSAVGSEKLKVIADKGGGLYAGVVNGIRLMADYLVQMAGQELKQSQNEREIWLDAGYYLLIIPLICALYFFRRGILSVVLLCIFAGSAQAGFFLNNNQEGLKAFNKQDYEQAAEKFDIPAWKASSYYRSGNFAEAHKYFAGTDAESLYNQGNALAKGGRIEEAIEAYEKVLEQIPEHEDAKFNLEYLKQQQQNQQQQTSSDSKQQQEQNQQQSQSEQNSEQNQQPEDQQSSPQDGSSGGEGEQNQDVSSADKPSSDERSAKDEEDNGLQKQQSDAENNGNEADENNRQQQSSAQPTETGDQTEKEADTSVGEEGKPEDNPPEYDEAAQAREQQFRNIPEDAGGLLRAFIRREYLKNRYKDN